MEVRFFRSCCFAGLLFPLSSFALFAPADTTTTHLRAERLHAGAVQLNWSTPRGHDADRFVVERSADGLHFTAIGTMPATAAFDVPQHYAFVDRAPLAGPNHYRLHCLEEHGRTILTTAHSVRMDSPGLPVFTEPVSDLLPLPATAEGPAEVLDAAGRNVPVKEVAQGDALDISALKPGTYYLRIGKRTARFTKR